MEKDNSWISIHRKFKDWQWYKDVNIKAIFLHLLLIANFQDNYWKDVFIKRGQVITSIQHLANANGLSVQQTRTAINKLKSTGEITIKSTSKYSLITIEKYSLYQKNSNQSTNSLTNKLTINQQTNEKKSTTNNNDNTNNIYLYLLNKYSEQIKKENESKKFSIISACKNSSKYSLLTLEEQDKLFYELMDIDKRFK